MPDPTPWRPNGLLIDGWDPAFPQPAEVGGVTYTTANFVLINPGSARLPELLPSNIAPVFRNPA
jgi:hypothetical protein